MSEEKAKEVTAYFNKTMIKSLNKMFEGQHELAILCGIRVGFVILEPEQQIYHSASIACLQKNLIPKK